MQAERDKMKAAGFTEEEMAAQGFGQEDVAAAGQVTQDDLSAAEEDLDKDQIMAEQISGAVQGVIEGIMNIASALPEILSELIPMLLTDLPLALIEMIGPLIEELIPVLLEELPKALFNLLFKVLPRLVKALLMDLPKALVQGLVKWWGKVWSGIKKFFKSVFSFGILQTGGYIPKTGMALLHQGERVVPSNGASTGTADKGLAAFTGGGAKSNITINTSVVDPEAIPSLGRLLDQHLGAYGQMEIPIFGSQSAPQEV